MAVTTVAPLTLEEFSRLPRDGEQHEISAGELITMAPPKSLHSRIARKLFKLLEAMLERSGSREAFLEAGYVLARNSLTIRQPDISVLTKERVRSTGEDDYFEGAPELAIEVVSPSDAAEDLQIKVDQYLAAGAKQVWILYPKTKCVHAFFVDGSKAKFDETQMLTGGDLLPEFSAKVSDLFLN